MTPGVLSKGSHNLFSGGAGVGGGSDSGGGSGSSSGSGVGSSTFAPSDSVAGWQALAAEVLDEVRQPL